MLVAIHCLNLHLVRAVTRLVPGGRHNANPRSLTSNRHDLKKATSLACNSVTHKAGRWLLKFLVPFGLDLKF